MVATAKTWTSTLNNAMSGADQRVQYREVFFGLYRAFVDAGWTREWTCNGLVASAADNLPNAAAVVIGLNVTQPISYFVMAAPANFIRGGGTMRVLVATNVTNVSTVPQLSIMRVSRGPYTLHPTVPLQNVPVATQVERSITTPNIIPHAVLTASSYHVWTTTAGDVVVGVKPNGVAQMRMLTAFLAPTTAIDTGSLGALTGFLVNLTASAASAITNVTVGVAGSFAALHHDGEAATSSQLWSPALEFAVLWTSGVDEAGETCFTPVQFIDYGNSTLGGLWGGYVVDVWGCPNNLPLESTDTGDADPIRLVSIGALALPTIFAQLPMN
jgi:hypothetical protein